MPKRIHKQKKQPNSNKKTKRTFMNLTSILPTASTFPSTVPTPLPSQNRTSVFNFTSNQINIKNLKNGRFRENSTTGFSDPAEDNHNYYLHKVFLSYLNKGEGVDFSHFRNHFEHTLKIYGIIKDIKDNYQEEKENNSLNKNSIGKKEKKKLLVLDLDETLISSNECPPHNWEDVYIINIALSNGEEKTFYVRFRPFACQFITAMAEHFDLAVFTASNKAYADPIIDKLDPRKLIRERLYNRDCDKINGIFVKDLKKFGRSLRDVVIVDNTVLCFALQLENGIPILPYYGDVTRKDTELIELKNFLIELKKRGDVRKAINRYFKWNMFDSYSDINKLVNSIFA